jgi:hypothetical protein
MCAQRDARELLNFYLPTSFNPCWSSNENSIDTRDATICHHVGCGTVTTAITTS